MTVLVAEAPGVGASPVLVEVVDVVADEPVELFANTAGGTLLIGVDDEATSVRSWHPESAGC